MTTRRHVIAPAMRGSGVKVTWNGETYWENKEMIKCLGRSMCHWMANIVHVVFVEGAGSPASKHVWAPVTRLLLMSVSFIFTLIINRITCKSFINNLQKYDKIVMSVSFIFTLIINLITCKSFINNPQKYDKIVMSLPLICIFIYFTISIFVLSFFV